MQWRGFAIMGKTRVMTRERPRPWRGPRWPNSPLRLSLDTFVYDPAFGIRVVAGATVRLCPIRGASRDELFKRHRP